MDRLGRRHDLEPEVLGLRDHLLPLYEGTVPTARSPRDYPNEAVARLDLDATRHAITVIEH
ncbi:MAG: hypothetical protein ABSE77_15655 [Acidimicrobiales bacterium]